MFDHSDADQHAALFAAFDVTPGDWQSLALALAARHEPALFRGEARRGPGAPTKWDPIAELCAEAMVSEVQEASQSGRINRNLSTLTAACEFLTENSQDARGYRARAFIPEGTTVENLRNRVSAVRAEMKRRTPS